MPRVEIVKRTSSRFVCKLLEDLACPSSEQAQMVRDLKDFYHRMGGSALQTFEGKLREFTGKPDAYLGFVDEATFADQLRSYNIPHCFIPKTGTPTPDIEATILGRKTYFEIKAIQEDRYMSLIENILEQIKDISSNCQVTIIPKYVGRGKEDSLVVRMVQNIRSALAEGDYSPIQHEDGEGCVYVLFNSELSASGQPWRFTWPEHRTVCGIPFLEYKLEEALKGNIKQFQAYKPTFLVWYTWDQSLWDFETQEDFRIHISHVLEQYVDVAGIIVAAPGWALFENPSYPEYGRLKHIGLFDAIRALQRSNAKRAYR